MSVPSITITTLFNGKSVNYEDAEPADPIPTPGHIDHKKTLMYVPDGGALLKIQGGDGFFTHFYNGTNKFYIKPNAFKIYPTFEFPDLTKMTVYALKYWVLNMKNLTGRDIQANTVNVNNNGFYTVSQIPIGVPDTSVLINIPDITPTEQIVVSKLTQDVSDLLNGNWTDAFFYPYDFGPEVWATSDPGETSFSFYKGFINESSSFLEYFIVEIIDTIT